MRMKNKKWAIPFLNEHKEIVLYNEEYNNTKLHEFIKHTPTYLEIGTGKGDFILNMSKLDPNGHFLGIEKSVTCLAITAKKIVADNILNVLLVADDVCKIVDYIPSGSVDTIFLNFSDPWPKKRHEKRRLTHKNFLRLYQRILKPNGTIVMKTDNLDLFDFSIQSLTDNNFILENIDYNYDGKSQFDCQTEYETYFRNEKTPIKRLIAKVGNKNEIE